MRNGTKKQLETLYKWLYENDGYIDIIPKFSTNSNKMMYVIYSHCTINGQDICTSGTTVWNLAEMDKGICKEIENLKEFDN